MYPNYDTGSDDDAVIGLSYTDNNFLAKSITPTMYLFVSEVAGVHHKSSALTPQ